MLLSLDRFDLIFLEWADQDEDSVNRFVASLTKLSQDLMLDGWLINIENKLSKDQVDLMVKLLKDLTGGSHSCKS